MGLFFFCLAILNLTVIKGLVQFEVGFSFLGGDYWPHASVLFSLFKSLQVTVCTVVKKWTFFRYLICFFQRFTLSRLLVQSEPHPVPMSGAFTFTKSLSVKNHEESDVSVLNDTWISPYISCSELNAVYHVVWLVHLGTASFLSSFIFLRNGKKRDTGAHFLSHAKSHFLTSAKLFYYGTQWKSFILMYLNPCKVRKALRERPCICHWRVITYEIWECERFQWSPVWCIESSAVQGNTRLSTEPPA